MGLGGGGLFYSAWHIISLLISFRAIYCLHTMCFASFLLLIVNVVVVVVVDAIVLVRRLSTYRDQEQPL